MENKVQVNEKTSPTRDSSLNRPISRRRSFFLWILFFSYALFSLSGWVRMIDSIVDWRWLSFAGVRQGPLYLTISGAVWGVAGMTAVIWLWLRRPWARTAAFVIALFFTLTYWVDRLLLNTPTRYGSNIVFEVVITLVGLLYALSVLRPWNEIRQLSKR